MKKDNSEDIVEIEDTRPEYMKKRVIVPSVTAIVFLICGIFYAVHTVYYKSTDDAFIEGHVITVAPRVSGPVMKLNIDDNQEVKKGDLLLEIDPNDYQAKLKETKAKLDEAKAALVNSENQVTKTLSDLEYAQADFDRYSQTYSKGISSKQEYDSSFNKLTVAQSNSKSAKARYDELTASIKRLEAEVEQDELNLSYTKIYASSDGRITNRSVEQGNYVQVAQPMFSIVPEKMWIVANFKETQLANMKPGQPVQIKIDTYELRFIVSIFLELDYFKKYLSDDVELDINDFKSIITTRVTEILKKATNENNFIYALVDSIDLKLDNKKDDIEHNYKIIKNMINKNKIKYNYCYLFDDVKYFNDNLDKKNNYFLFLTMILKNSI